MSCAPRDRDQSPTAGAEYSTIAVSSMDLNTLLNGADGGTWAQGLL
jgi:hypothetical protein